MLGSLTVHKTLFFAAISHLLVAGHSVDLPGQSTSKRETAGFWWLCFHPITEKTEESSATARAEWLESIGIRYPVIERAPDGFVINLAAGERLILTDVDGINRMDLPVRSAPWVAARHKVGMVAGRVAGVEKHVSGDPDRVLPELR